MGNRGVIDKPQARRGAGAGAKSGSAIVADLAQVLRTIRTEGAATRTEIEARTGLGRGVVAARVTDLLDAGIVGEMSPDESTGGRPPHRLSVRGDRGVTLVAQLGATGVDVGVIDLAGTLLARRSEAIDVRWGPDAVLGRIELLLDRLRVAIAPSAPVWGVGLGIPGPVEFSTGRPVAPPIMPGWNAYPIRERLSARFGAPSWVDNDVNLAALGEWREGIARGHANVVFVKMGTGIGAGVIAAGALHRGSVGSAGDVGHVKVSDDPDVVCRCGNLGCLEAIAGGGAMAREATDAALAGQSPFLSDRLGTVGTLQARDIAEAALHGDPFARNLLRRSGRYCGAMLATVVNFFNPSLIVIGGGLAGAGDVLLATVRTVVTERALPLATRDLVITWSILGDDAGLIGAGTMVRDELFSPPVLAAWLLAGSPAGRTDLPGAVTA
jgi:glucokinase-like ROK family protein